MTRSVTLTKEDVARAIAREVANRLGIPLKEWSGLCPIKVQAINGKLVIGDKVVVTVADGYREVTIFPDNEVKWEKF